MRRLFAPIGRLIFWTYERGSWQYDLLCALILAFIFLTPKEYFHRPPFYTEEGPKLEQQQDRKGEKLSEKRSSRETKLPGSILL
jgi:hypothetical protein